MRKIIISLLLLCMHFSTRGQTPYEYRYWFDGDISTAVTGSTTSDAWRMEIDLSRLTESFHTIHLQVTDEKGVSSSPATRCFFLSREGGALTNGYYWFDNEVQTRNVRGDVQGSLTFDVSELQEGFHTIHYQVLREDGLYSQIETRSFYKMQSDQIVGELTFMCYIDGKDFKQERVSVENGAAVWFLDVSELPIGFHKLQVKAIMQNGASSSIREAFFLRSAMDAEMEALSCVFSIDGKPYKTIESGVHEGVFRCDLDVAGLSDGLHKIAYMFTNGKGAQTNIKSQYFVKTPVGGNSIKMYQYWINDNDDMAHTVEQTEVTDPLKLITLLPVEPQPIRSSLFHFETKSGKPMMYAKNEIHLRFYDNSGRWVDASDQYIDYAFGQEVKPVGALQPTQTFNKVASNDVRWYTMQSAPGDTTAFKLGQPATVQVFAPSGAEVFKTSESASVNWSGIHTWEEGTYYLAVHDVTGSQSTMKLEYMHMDKYDVVDWDVHRVGNGGCSTITFKGNGFRDLYAVDLYNTQGDSIKSVAVGFIDDANVSVTFNFTDVPLGNYNAVFHFTTENKKFHDIITVEEAKDIELALDVRYPSSFLRGTSTTYAITVTNNGNSTAYDVPMEIYLSAAANSFEDITSVKFKDEQGKEFNNFTLDMIEEKDSLDDETREYLESVFAEFVGIQSFIVVNDSLGSGEYGFTDQLITISPNSSMTFYVEIKSSSAVALNVRIPSKWITIHSESETVHARRKKSKASESNLCCEKEKWECIVSLVTDVVGFIPVAGCVASLVDSYTFVAFEFGCAEGDNIQEKFWDYCNAIANNPQKHQSANSKSIWTIINCVTLSIGKIITKLNKELKLAKQDFDSAWNKYTTYKRLAKEANTAQAKKLYEEWAANAYKKVEELNSKVLQLREDLAKQANLIDFTKNQVLNGIQTTQDSECIREWRQADANCPPNPTGGGGTSTPQPPADPNDIYGYLSEAGSKFIADSVARVNYTIEFENDTTFATAAAHTIVIRDTLDSRIFDLTKFLPTGVRIGSHEVLLDNADVVTKNNVTSFVKTIDMRPEINAIAQVEGEFNHKKGTAQWTFTSLDPMTMEPTYDLMQGILPVNFDGTSGIGEVMFEVGVKSGKADGTEIKNRAGIVFDYEAQILTPTWTNVVDAVPPTSSVTDCTMVNDSTLRIFADGFDARSGVWKYEWYVQHGENAPWWKEGETESPSFDFHFFPGFDYGLCVVVTDSAGNVEKKQIARERLFKSYGKDYEDGVPEVLEAPSTKAPADGDVYDLSGRKRSEPQENDINIINKKKVFIQRKKQ